VRGHRDLERAARAALLCALAALVLPLEPLEVLFALPLALFLPGYAIAAATFARRPLGWAPLLLLSLALSLAVLALGTLVLDFVPGGVRGISWALLLLLVILNGCRLAALRRPAAAGGSATSWPRPLIGRPQALLLGGGGLAALAALVLAMAPLPANNALGYTELWISTKRDSIAAPVVRVGVRSQEKRKVSYFLRVAFGGGEPVVRLFDLEPGEQQTFRVAAPPGSPQTPVVASLFRQAKPTKIYRRVVLVAPGERVAATERAAAGGEEGLATLPAGGAPPAGELP
jgi:uncharacterized membrane protein